MRFILIITVAAFVGGIATNPAKAEDSAPGLAPTSEWSVQSKSDRCVLSRNFGEGEDATTLRLEQGGPGPRFNLTFIGRPVRYPSGRAVSVQFHPEEPSGRTYISSRTTSGRPAMMMFGATFLAAKRNDEEEFEVQRLNGERLAALTQLRISRAGLKPFALETGPLLEPMQAMNICTLGLGDRLNSAAEGRQGGSQAAKPVGSPGTWITPSDYPSLMQAFGQGGTLQVRLTVNERGKATFCHIESSTVPQMFDDAVCLNLIRRAEFEPAKDAAGDPAASYWRNKVRFEIR